MKPSPTLETSPSASVVGAGLSDRKRTARPGSARKEGLNLKSRPLERNLALFVVLLAGIGVLGGLLRELTAGSNETHFIAMLAIPSLLTALATGIALPRQDEKFRPWWSAATYLALIVMIVLAPAIATWSSQMGFGASPAIVPVFAGLICVLAPFAIPNQAALGLGSAVPKVLVVLWSMHFTDGTSLGITASNLFLSPQSALVALALLTGATSLLMMFFRYRMPTWMMFLIGLLATIPCISKLDFCLVHLGFM